MENCTEFAALLDPYIDGELSAADAARVRAHLAVCGRCRAYVQAALAIRDAFPDAEDTEMPEGFAESVMAAVRADAAPRRRRRPRWQRTLLPLAACFAVAVLAVSGLPRLQDNTAASTAADAAEAAAITEETRTAGGDEAGGQAAVTSADAEESAPAEEKAGSPADGSASGPMIYSAQGEAASAPENGRIAEEPASAGDGSGTQAAPQMQSGSAAEATEDAAPSCFATLTLTREQAGTALKDLPPETPVSSDPATGGTVYYLTAEQFEELLDELGDPPYTAEGDGGLARVILLPEGAGGETLESFG